MLVPLGKEKVVLLSEICGAVVDVILNLLLIPCFCFRFQQLRPLLLKYTYYLSKYMN